jgi:dienelactone hydrolase
MCRGIANGMLQRGYATLCYDKRGVGDSTGDYVNIGITGSEERFSLLASDMEAGVRFLRARPDIDARRVGLMGPSQAGWIIPIAAGRIDAAFMILLVGPTVSVGEEIYYSKFAEGTATPASEISPILAKYSGPRGFDPRPVLETLKVPGLWLLGDADRSIPTVETVAILDDLIKRGRPFTRIVYPGAGHNLGGTPFWSDVDRFLTSLR